MKTSHIVLAGSLTLFGWAWSRRTSATESATYGLSFELASEGSVSIEALLAADGAPIALRAMLADKTFGLSRLEAFDERGERLPVVLEATSVEGAGGARCFTRAVVDPGASPAVHLRYRVTPGTYLPPAGDNEIRQCGRVSERGCVLSLANLLLLPEGGLARLELEVELPSAWTTLGPLPRVLEGADRASLWSTSLVAGDYASETFDLATGVRARVPRGSSAAAIDAMRALARAVEGILGAPREPVEVIVPPLEAQGAAWTVAAPVELPAASRVPVVDVRGSDPASLRRFVTRLLAAWWGRSPLELELDAHPDAWFALGLREYLAYLLPARAGLVDRDPAFAIENSWVSQPELQPIDLRTGTDGSRQSQYARRLVSMALLHDLDRALPGGLTAHLRGYEGRGFPLHLARGPVSSTFQAFLSARLERGERRLSFESDWTLPWDPAPTDRDGGAPVAALSFAFTSDTTGFLETCGCKAGQDGGVARRASVLREWRQADPRLVLIDLGNFSAVGQAEAALDPGVAEEQALYPALHEMLGYDAVVLGPDELYSGFARRFPAAAGAGSDDLRENGLSESGRTRSLGGGIELEGEPLGASSAVIERAGISIGIVGYSELLENAHARQAQEANMSAVAFPETPDLAALRELRSRVDLLVVAGRMRPATLRLLADPSLGVDLVLSARHALTFEAGASGFLGTTAVAFDQMTFVGLNRVDLFLSAEGRVLSVRGSGRLLDEDVPDDPTVRARLDEFYSSSAVAGAQVKPLFQGDLRHRDPYVGSEQCASCHAEQYRSWLGTPHATAMRTLEAGRRDRNPSCVKCHVVGLGTESGYSIAKPSASLGAVGCENCHGAGERHVRAPRRDNIQRTPGLATCLECHVPKHSELFEQRFEQAWRQVLHR